MNTRTDTIVALSSAPGSAALSLIRVSGPAALSIWKQLAPAHARPLIPRRSTLAQLDLGGGSGDSALVTAFHGSSSFTGEDMLEITCHGNPTIVKKILARACSSGARLAKAGEFTQRAFLNGKVDLTQAEGIMDLIAAQTDLSLAAALATVRGGLREKISELRESLISVLAHVEAHIDFPDEDISPDTSASIAAQLAKTADHIRSLLATAECGKILREGIHIAIVGRANAGKSSLFNTLCGEDRAIVAPTPGTTRDTVEEWVTIGGAACKLSDTAGLRTSDDDIEQEGMRRSVKAAASARILLHLFDSQEGYTREDEAIAQRCLSAAPVPPTLILVATKQDLQATVATPPQSPWFHISATTGQGIPELREAIAAAIWRGDAPPVEGAVTINARHRLCLENALPGIQTASAGALSHLSPEILSLEIREALSALDDICGAAKNEEVLDKLFSTFCIGK